MIDQPLLSHTFLLVLWLILAFAVTIFFTIVQMVTNKPPLRSQTNIQTGMRHHSLFLWACAFGAFWMGPPLGILALGWLANHFWMIPVGFVVVCLFFVLRHFWLTREPRQQVVEYQEPDPQQYLTPFPQQQVVPAPAPQMWTAETTEFNWAQRPTEQG